MVADVIKKHFSPNYREIQNMEVFVIFGLVKIVNKRSWTNL